jgi:hypothetical protein
MDEKGPWAVSEPEQPAGGSNLAHASIRQCRQKDRLREDAQICGRCRSAWQLLGYPSELVPDISLARHLLRIRIGGAQPQGGIQLISSRGKVAKIQPAGSPLHQRVDCPGILCAYFRMPLRMRLDKGLQRVPILSAILVSLSCSVCRLRAHQALHAAKTALESASWTPHFNSRGIEVVIPSPE